MDTNETFLVFPDPAPPDLVRCLDLGGYRWKTAAGMEAPRGTDGDAWTGAIVAADTQPEAAWALCRELRRGDVPTEPLLVLISLATAALGVVGLAVEVRAHRRHDRAHDAAAEYVSR